MANEVLTLKDLLGKPDFLPTQRMESIAERLVLDHVRSRRTIELFPLSTDDLYTLVEEHVADLNVYENLDTYGDEVEGITLFQPGTKPLVRVSASLSASKNENRLRSTLAHELGHVLLHDSLFQRKSQDSLFDASLQYMQVCYRDGAESAGHGDLFEYQAWYMCGALLMPITELRAQVTTLAQEADSYSEIWQHSVLGRMIVEMVASSFGVSMALARIRLLKTGLICESEPSPALF
jgi:hypothetical protein